MHTLLFVRSRSIHSTAENTLAPQPEAIQIFLRLCLPIFLSIDGSLWSEERYPTLPGRDT